MNTVCHRLGSKWNVFSLLEGSGWVKRMPGLYIAGKIRLHPRFGIRWRGVRWARPGGMSRFTRSVRGPLPISIVLVHDIRAVTAQSGARFHSASHYRSDNLFTRLRSIGTPQPLRGTSRCQQGVFTLRGADPLTVAGCLGKTVSRGRISWRCATPVGRGNGAIVQTPLRGGYGCRPHQDSRCPAFAWTQASGQRSHFC
jgi:hypothetical protein